MDVKKPQTAGDKLQSGILILFNPSGEKMSMFLTEQGCPSPDKDWIVKNKQPAYKSVITSWIC
jgi:hypothetical protein